MPSLLRGAGYRTALIGKWHLGFLPRYSPLRSGYDEFFGIMGGFTGYYTHVGEGGTHDLYEAELPVERAGYVTDLLNDRARAYIEAAANSANRISSACTTMPRTGRGPRPRSRRRRDNGRWIRRR